MGLNLRQDDSPRARFDGARLDLQKAHEALEEAQTPYRLLRGLFRELVANPWRRLTGKTRRAMHANDRFLKTESFRPTQVRIRTPGHPREERPRVVHIIGNLTVGGSSRLVVDLVEWTSDVCEHFVVSRYIPSPAAYSGLHCTEMTDAGVKDFARLFSRTGADLVHIHHYAEHHTLYQEWQWYRAAFQAAGALQLPVIENVNVPMTPYVHPGVAAYVFVSEHVRENFGFQHCPNQVIYPGSDFTLFKPQPHTFSDTIGMVYRLDESKLRKDSIEVFIKVLQARKSARALIVGDGPLLPHFKARVSETGMAARFSFPGYVAYDDLPAYYNQMDVFVAPVFCESFGQVTPFAMNMGIPVAAYNTGALGEILADPSVLAPPGAARPLADIIVALLSNPQRRNEVSRQNRLRAEALFSVQAMVQAYSNLYLELLGKTGTSSRPGAVEPSQPAEPASAEVSHQ